VFNPDHLDTYYTLSQFHIMGSRILSRSFHVEPWKGGGDSEEPHVGDDPDVSMESRRSTDADRSREEAGEQPAQEDSHPEGEENVNDSDSDSEDGENVEDVAMVPMADMLNARYGGENVSLPAT
jgi:SET domain-containing protein 6